MASQSTISVPAVVRVAHAEVSKPRPVAVRVVGKTPPPGLTKTKNKPGFDWFAKPAPGGRHRADERPPGRHRADHYKGRHRVDPYKGRHRAHDDHGRHCARGGRGR